MSGKRTRRAVVARMASDGLSARTVAERDRVLRRFEAAVGRPARKARRRDVDEWWASTEGLAPASRAAYLAHVRAFYVAAGLADVTSHVRRPRVPDYAPRPVDEADLAVALAMIGGDVGVWVALAGRLGLRCGEIAALRPASVVDDGVGPALRVDGKGARVRYVPVDDEVGRRLAGYSWPDVTPARVSKLVARALRGVGVDATAHRLRHTAATRYLAASGYDLAGTSRLLGHANVSTTMVYARTDTRRAREVLARLD